MLIKYGDLFYLIIFLSIFCTVQPTSIELKKEISGSDTNLTCISHDSRPLATFQWFKDDLNVTGESYGPYAALNETCM